MHGRQLWKSDGTSAGTLAVNTTAPISDGGSVQQAAVGSTLYFGASGPGGTELWSSDGTSAGTGRVEDINPTGDAAPRSLVAVGNRVAFSADDGVSGRELWVSDGTAEGTLLAADLNTATPNARPEGLLVAGSTAFFAADDGVHGYELWKTDGTSAGTKLVKDIAPGSRSGLEASWDYAPAWSAVAMGDAIFFAANDGVRGTGLWKSDGTEAGTTRLSNAVPGQMAVIGTRLVFVTEDGQQLWKSNGTKTGTKRIKSFETVGTGRGWISELTSVGNLGYMAVTVETPANGYPDEDFYLWRTNGTAAGTQRVATFEDGPPTELTPVGTDLFFTLPDSGQLWRSNGSTAGTSLVKQMPDAWGGLQSLTPVGTDLFFTFDGIDWVPQLWVSDGSSAGTQLVRQFPPVGGAATQPVDTLMAVGGKLLFLADDDNGPRDLWLTDGTAAGTECIWLFHWADPSVLRALDTLVYMADYSPATGSEPAYLIDYGLEGDPDCEPGDECAWSWTVEPLGDLNPGPASSDPAEFIQLGTNILFVADDGSHGREIWTAPNPVTGS